MKEIWKDIKGFNGMYKVSNLGNVKSVERYIKQRNKTYHKKEKILKNNMNNYGYLYVNLYYNGYGKGYLIHRLVAQEFIPNVDNKPTINHIDGNKTNNYVENLEWCSYLENNLHAIKNNLKDYSKISKPIKQIKNGEVINIFRSIHIASIKLNINAGDIGLVAKGKRKTAGGYKWEYV